jgi:MFS transporter, MHS family, proline/betaine transporter
MSNRVVELDQTAASAHQAVVATCVGNAVEWFDFALYGALGVLVTPLFFPSQDDATLLLAAFAVYATAFLVRPVGAVVFGLMADARGRKPVLVVVVLLMGATTAAIGLVPTYAVIGVAASVAVVLLRVGQGLAAGGELGLAAVFIAESAPEGRRGEVAAWHTATMAAGVAAGLSLGVLLHAVPPDLVARGVWRLAFLVALPLGLIGFYLRRRVSESALFVEAARERTPQRGHVARLWAQHRRACVTGFSVVAAGSLAFNTFFIYLPNHLIATTDSEPGGVLLVSVLALLCAAGAALGMGRLSDSCGRRPVVLTSTAVLAVVVAPVAAVSHGESWAILLVTDLLAGAAVGGILSVSMLAEMFPTGMRATGLALTAGLASALVGGTAPFVDQVLFQATGRAGAPMLYVAVAAVVAFGCVWTWPETAFGDLSRGSQPLGAGGSGESS